MRAVFRMSRTGATGSGVGGGGGGPVLVAFGVLEHAEEQRYRQKVEQNFHGVIMAEPFSA